MLRISQLKLPAGQEKEEVRQALLSRLSIKEEELLSWEIRRRSLDARKKPVLRDVYTIDFQVKNEKKVRRAFRKKGNCSLEPCREKPYRMPENGQNVPKTRPVVAGFGPAGLFCAWLLAKKGLCPLVIEQGAPVEERKKDVEHFWKSGELAPFSNVQFGEGGAGTFSDGKLNTLIKDPEGRIRKVLEVFVEHGAPEEILYDAKPHIGTDLLGQVVQGIRREIQSLGGEIRFYTRLTGLETEGRETGNVLKGIRCQDVRTGEERKLECQTLVLAPGHSARHTFRMLWETDIPMEAKAFAVGVRVEHPQTLINHSQYGTEEAGKLGAAAYKLSYKEPEGRGVYSFCMCPGGYVVNASSEEGYLAVNGMSYHARDGKNANSAIVVTVTPEDFGSAHPLAGIAFQRRLEQAAFSAGGGKIPVQRLEDFEKNVPTRELTAQGWEPCMKGAWQLANLRPVFPEEISRSLLEGMKKFDARIRGFSSPDTLLSGVESRTSSPVRILRGETMESSVAGLYPCGEGAGYAGGITSAAVDGLKVAEKICARYAPFDRTGKV